MAGDWIKMRTDLADDPAVIRMAMDLNVDEDTIVGKLHRLWSWADRQSVDGHIRHVSTAWLDRFLRADGFSKAMQESGWLVVTQDGISFPGFEKHNGETAKKRIENAARQAKKRGKRDESVTKVTKNASQKSQKDSTGVTNSCDTSVTNVTSKRDEPVTNVTEKRDSAVTIALPREEKSTEEERKEECKGTLDHPSDDLSSADDRSAKKPAAKKSKPDTSLPLAGTPIGDVVAAWNALGEPFSKITVLNPDRRASLNARLRDKFWVESWRQALAIMPTRKFCTGGNDSGWVANFDWFIRPRTVQRLLEGNYVNRKPKTQRLLTDEEAMNWNPTDGGLGSIND